MSRIGSSDSKSVPTDSDSDSSQFQPIPIPVPVGSNRFRFRFQSVPTDSDSGSNRFQPIPSQEPESEPTRIGIGASLVLIHLRILKIPSYRRFLKPYKKKIMYAEYEANHLPVFIETHSLS